MDDSCCANRTPDSWSRFARTHEPALPRQFRPGLRVLQISAALPQGQGGRGWCRLTFTTPFAAQAPEKASATEWEIYKELPAQKNINRVAFQRLAGAAPTMDQHGSAQRGLVVGWMAGSPTEPF